MAQKTKEEWPVEEARRILDRVGSASAPIRLETGFGPSGLPHIGTFGEVIRTTFIMRALVDLGATDVSCIVFSDDMDGLRKVPQNMPDWLGEHLGKTLNEIPDPFGVYDSYSRHMNARLVGLLERMTRRFRCAFRGESAMRAGQEATERELAKPDPDLEGIDLGPYVFTSSVTQYRSGVFNEALKLMLERVEAIRGVILPTLSESKRDAWSPFIPRCSQCGKIYTTRVVDYHPERHSLTYRCDRPMGTVSGCGHEALTEVTDGKVKVGWKVDWALRWFVLGITYEMYGKDLIESASLSKKIVKILGGRPLVDYFYEMFLDEDGAKISKSVGRGVTVDSWLDLAPFESIALFMYRNPKRAKRLFYGVIPQYVDEFIAECQTLNPTRSSGEAASPSPVLRFLDPDPPAVSPYPEGLSFGTLVNMVGSIGSRDPEIIRKYLARAYALDASQSEALDSLTVHAAAYYEAVVLPTREEYTPTSEEKVLFLELAEFLEGSHDPEVIQKTIFSMAKESEVPPKQLFRALYGVLTGQERGPRLGSFIKILGETEVRERLLAASS